MPASFLRSLRSLRGHLDDARNLQKIQTAASRIYEYFKSQVTRPPNDTER